MGNDAEKGQEVDLEKRGTLRRMISMSAFAAPVIVSFPLSGVTIDTALAACRVVLNSVPDPHAPGGFRSEPQFICT
jgi:hypothetical protein